MRAFKILILTLILLPSTLQAGCGSGQGKPGQFKMISNSLKYCNGTEWLSMSETISASACAESGKIRINGNDFQYCNGTVWLVVDNGNLPALVCPAGKIELQGDPVYCGDGSVWKSMALTPVGGLPACGVNGDQPSCDGTPDCIWDGVSCNNCVCPTP